MSNMSVFALIVASLIATVYGGAIAPVLPLAASVPYATSYSAHSVNHAIAAPVVAAPAAPIVAAPAAYSALPAAYPYSAYPYSAYPYSAYPYAAYPYSAYPYSVVARR
ncbi:protein lifeguard 1-like [Diaphorina citri]|uniref:Protein lifeguard 1-like n=1 Tax=Diaphorina citri TaxID=121845 RepID=A0A1S3D568_DIACI|nr:protein lifeguard 1-like [Diaphorina citri]KAI5720959.1 hypothetical protein M8J77_013926 [Diaphorina citri]